MDLSSKTKLTQNQRISQRWKRVQLKKKSTDSIQPSNNKNIIKENVGNTNNNLMDQPKNQIKQSRNSIDSTSTKVAADVTDIELQSQIKECERRHTVEHEHQQRMYRLEQQIEKGKELNNTIDNEWTDLLRIRNPQILYNEINNVKTKCSQLILAYETTRKTFMGEFKKKSEEYVQMLKNQETDVTQIIWRMHNSIKKLKEQYETQINAIEKAFKNERKDILKINSIDIKKLFDTRNTQELSILAKKILSDDKYSQDLEKVRREDHQSYNKLKINLENHIQLLEQQLEEMRAMYQLNTEKLNYNFQVLKEREKENITTVDHLKRREKKLKDSVLNVKTKCKKQEKKFQNEEKLLNDEFQRISKQYKQLQKKFKHFQKTDIAKYQEICDMNREEAIVLLQNIMKADQIISTHILGLEWNSNEWQIPQTITKLLFNELHANNHSKNLHSPTPTIFSSSPSNAQNMNIFKQTSAKNGIQSPANKESNTDKNSSQPTTDDCIEVRDINQNQPSQKYTTEQIMKVLKLLINEAPFLINVEIQQSLHLIPIDQQLVYQSDSILRSLGIEDIEDIEELVSLFIKESNEISIEPYETIQIIKKYVSERGDQQHTKTTNINFTIKRTLTSATKEKIERRKRKDQEYWHQLQNVFPIKKVQMWTSLETYLIDYGKLLNARKNEAMQILQLEEQNVQLRQLLKQYLMSDTNKELLIPPSLVIDAQLL